MNVIIWLNIIKLFFLFVAIAFVKYGLDTGQKTGMRAFIPQSFILLMKQSCVLLLFFFLYALFKLEDFSFVFITGLLLGSCGTYIIFIAKKTLGESFTWTGHYKENSKLVTKGIYSYLRNPLYSGVFLVEIAYLLIVTKEVFFPLEGYMRFVGFFLLYCPFMYAFGFNLVMAKMERDCMRKEYLDEYVDYEENVPAFIPRIKKPYRGYRYEKKNH